MQTGTMFDLNCIIIIIPHQSKMTSKRVNWTEKEEEALMTEVNQRRDVIEGKFKRQGFPGGVTQKAKTAAWEEIHEALAR